MIRTRLALIALVAVPLLTTCELVSPPFVWDNPWDPHHDLEFIDSFGHPLYESVGGLAHLGSIAVWRNGEGEEVLFTPQQGHRIRSYRPDANEYGMLVLDEHGGDVFFDLAIVPGDGGDFLYAAASESIHRVHLSSGTIDLRWADIPERYVRRLAADPDGALWALISGSDGESYGDPRFLLSTPDGTMSEPFSFPPILDSSMRQPVLDFAVGSTLVAVVRDDLRTGRDVLFLDRATGEPTGRLVYDGAYQLVPPDDDRETSIRGERIVYNQSEDRFVLLTARHLDGNAIVYLDGITGSFLSATGTDTDLAGHDWRGLAVAGPSEYVASNFTGEVVRVEAGWPVLHENTNEDPLGFIRLGKPVIDHYTDPPLLLATDHSHRSIQVIDTHTHRFERFFASRGHGPGELGDFRSVFIAEDAVYVSRYEEILRYGRDGQYLGILLDGIPAMEYFAVVGDILVGFYHEERGAALYTHNIATGWHNHWHGFAAHGPAAIDVRPDPAGGLTDEIVVVVQDYDRGDILIGTLDLLTLEPRWSGDFPFRDLFPDGQPGVHLVDVTVTPQGFVWINSENDTLIQTDMTGEIYRTIGPGQDAGRGTHITATAQGGYYITDWDHRISEYGIPRQ